MSDNCSWYFPVIVNEHKQGENDALTDLFSGPTFHALVRESLQNSLDAHQKDNPSATKVEFVLRTLPSSKLKEVFDIRDHVEACMEYCGETTETEGGKFSSMVKYLVILILSLGALENRTQEQELEGLMDMGRRHISMPQK